MKKTAKNFAAVKDLKKTWKSLLPQIESRLSEFKDIWRRGSEKQVFAELIFCIFTPQSKAQNCWSCVENIFASDLLFTGKKNLLHKELNKVRFKYNKTRYALLATKLFSSRGSISVRPVLHSIGNDYERREWLVKNVKGIGYKEATHFLRNIGFAKDLAILDRHILRNLKSLGVIRYIPDSLSKQEYFSIEKKMKKFSETAGIPMAHMDLVMWYQATGSIFK